MANISPRELEEFVVELMQMFSDYNLSINKDKETGKWIVDLCTEETLHELFNELINTPTCDEYERECEE